MTPFLSILRLFEELRRADDRLQQAMKQLLPRYFAFIEAGGTRQLRMCVERGRDGRIRKLSWTRRVRARAQRPEAPKGLVRRLPEPFRSSWVYDIARDWRRVEEYRRFDDERRQLNQCRARVVNARKRLQLSLANRFARRATGEERARAEGIVAASPEVYSPRDVSAISGAVVFSRELVSIEEGILEVVAEFKRAFAGRADITFQPYFYRRANGLCRLTWGHALDKFARTPRSFARHIPDHPPDAWMRRIGIRSDARREVTAFVRRFVPLERTYADLAVWLGEHRGRVTRVTAGAHEFQLETEE